MSCDGCDAVYRIQTNGVDTVRNVCACETKTKKCRAKKCAGAVVQADLAPDGVEVFGYACHDHAVSELLDEELATPIVAVPDDDTESRAGQIIAEHVFLATKKAVLAEIKSQNYKVKCLSCQTVHPYSKRKPELEDKVVRILCPSCGHPGYQILE